MNDSSMVPFSTSASMNLRPRVAAARGIGARPLTASQNGPDRPLMIPPSPVLVGPLRVRLSRDGDPVLTGIDLIPAVRVRACRKATGQLGGGGPGELAEIADEMGLVGIASVTGDVCPVRRLALVQAAPDPVEADQPRRGLGPEPDLLLKLGDEVPVAPAHLGC